MDALAPSLPSVQSDKPAGVSLGSRTFIEALATAFLLVAVVGSGIMAERLSGGNVAIALLANSIATGGALVALILAFGPISGAHMNPAVTVTFAICRELEWQEAVCYVLAQIVGGIAGVWAAHLMFDMPIIEFSTHPRTGLGQWAGEIIATLGLLSVIWGCRPHAGHITAFAVAAYITGAYWFTSSTSFANPAVTIARALTNSFAGIQPHDAPAFIVAQCIGIAVALIIWRPLLRQREYKNA